MITRFKARPLYEADRQLRVAGKISRLEYTRRRVLARDHVRSVEQLKHKNATASTAVLDFLGAQVDVSGDALGTLVHGFVAVLAPPGSMTQRASQAQLYSHLANLAFEATRKGQGS